MQRWEYLEVWPDRVLVATAQAQRLLDYLTRCFPDPGSSGLQLRRPEVIAFSLARLDVVAALGADGWEPISSGTGLVAMRRRVE